MVLSDIKILMEASFVIQARLGSTRLPGKILLPFYKGKSILELLVEKLKQVEGCQIILATSTSTVNNSLEQFASNYGIECFRGSENDVLQRFIDAAEFYQSKHLIRVCSDNPFLELNSIRQLISFLKANKQYDYISYHVNGTPSIKTHYGFWTEYVSLEALKKVKMLTNESLYHEHVTNYIYTHPDDFNFYLLDTPDIISTHNKTRLTIDTERDFRNAQTVYNALVKNNPYPTIEDVISYLDNNSSLYQIMEQEILNNSK